MATDDRDIEDTAAMADTWYGPDIATFGDRVAAAREAAGMSQTDLARRLGVKLATIRGWEDDLSEPRANKLSMMAGLLGVSIVWLLTGRGDGVAPPVDAAPVSPDMTAVLSEIRDLRLLVASAADRLARLEKTLRTQAKGA